LGIFRLGSFLGHDGELFGYDSIMLYSPSQHVAVVVLGTTSPDLDIPPPSTKVITLQVAQRIYGIVFSGQTLPGGGHAR
jgi:hypothetical protein